MDNAKRTILGIDPGTNILGYGVLEISTQQEMFCKSLGVIKISAEKKNIDKLGSIYQITENLIAKHCPDELAIEAPFLGKNPQSALKLGRAQGVVIAACIKHHLLVAEYMPKKIKMSIAGKGNAEKEQVHKMIEQILKIKIDVKYLDATDALGVAICHFFQNKKSMQGEKKYKDWKDFIHTRVSAIPNSNHPKNANNVVLLKNK